jgi:hypothetical protein
VKRLALGAILAVSVVLGSLREFLFINLNYEIDRVAHHREVAYAHSRFRAWVQGWDLSGLVRLKWGMSLAFIVAMLLLCIALMRLVQGSFRSAPILGLGFAAVGTVALLFHGLSGLMPAFEVVAVKLLHMLQYPVVLIFLWAAEMLRRRRLS